MFTITLHCSDDAASPAAVPEPVKIEPVAELASADLWLSQPVPPETTYSDLLDPSYECSSLLEIMKHGSPALASKARYERASR